MNSSAVVVQLPVFSPLCNGDQSLYRKYLSICDGAVQLAREYSGVGGVVGGVVGPDGIVEVYDREQRGSCSVGFMGIKRNDVGFVVGEEGCGQVARDATVGVDVGGSVVGSGECGTASNCSGNLSSVDGISVVGSSRDDSERSCGNADSACVVSTGESVVDVPKRGKHYAKNLAKRLRRKLDRKTTAVVGKEDERTELQKSFDARRIAENKLAVQKAEFQLKRNEYMTKSRVAELEWETRRLQTDQKLEKITEARLGSKPGFAETLVENNISSTSLPSLSKGTISPDSSISVEEVRKMERLIETLSGQVQSLTTQLNGLQDSIKANQRFGGKFDLDENEKIIMPRFKTPDERLEWMANLSDEEMEALGPDYHRDGRKVEDGSRLSFDGYTEDYSLQDEAMKEAGITMIG